MSKSKHNLWKRRKNGQPKLVRSHKQWVAKHNHNREIFLQEELEKAKKKIVEGRV